MSFLAAVFALQWWQSPAYPWQLWMTAGAMGFLCSIVAVMADKRNALLPFAIMIGAAAAIWTVSRTTHVPSSADVDFHANGTEVVLRGFIADDPDRRAMQTNYTVAIAVLKKGDKTFAVGGNVLVTLRVGHQAFEYGDPVIVRGILELPEGNHDFRYDRYLSVKRIYSVMNNPTMDRAGLNRGNAVLRMIYRFRRSMEWQINELFPEPHASLLAGLLLGARGAMPEDLVLDFKTTGLTHIVAISGYNITILITAMGTLLFWMPLKWRFWPSSLLIAAFTLLTGASASAVRAAVMGILALLALQTNRIQTTRLTVLWSAFLMLAWNPKQMWYDAGFQLSFLALIGVLEISPLLQPCLRRLPERFGVRESFCLTLSAQALASPWILFLFGQLSLIAPLSNLLAPPAVPYAMLMGTISILFGWVWSPIGRASAMLAWLPLQWITGVAHALGAIPFASLTLTGFTTVWMVIYYACTALWVGRHAIVSSRVASHLPAEGRRVTTRICESSSFRSNAEARRFPSAAGAEI
ncbi:ComEC/Rec2 family competence protein [Candidatus Peregrinibacteria bacterium]|nr:ComEC/Rec2 family competence protein [Candidatus Peregrinibacteria bacterium]